ncbi:MAG TPA: EAL domain-containing protein [Gammaproteobacteria bacterium]
MNTQAQKQLLIYLKYIAVAMVIVGMAATFQLKYVYGALRPEFYFIPMIVATVLGGLLARTAVLKLQLKQQSDQYRGIVDMAQEFSFYRTLNGEYLYVTPSCEKITGYSQAEFYRLPSLMNELIYKEDQVLWFRHMKVVNTGANPDTFDVRIVARNGDIIWLSHICAPVYDDRQQLIGVRSTNLDITERKEYEEKIRTLALYDPLTNLPNRRSLENELAQYIYNGSAAEAFALLFLDLSRFKNINDSFGHSFGDRLLIEIANRLCYLDDRIFLSRFGGDEFVLLAPFVKSDAEAIKVATQVIEVVEQAIYLDGIELHVSGSIGIALYPRDGHNPETLISRADAAMYKTKLDGRGPAAVYSNTLGDQVQHFVSTENRIHKGLENNEFLVYYQPKINLNNGKVIGLEALVRWMHPEQGMIMPGEFIHVAEETGQIADIGNFVFNQVIHDLKILVPDGVAVPVAINMSARQFSSNVYCDHWFEILRQYECDNAMIELEVTEQVFLGDIDHASKRLQEFREIGLTIALDDFGTGYSSLNYLKHLPIDTLKIDMSFIRDLKRGNRAHSILKSIIQMAHDLGLKTVAEGVELEEQEILLRSMNCDYAQGYLFYRPMPAHDVFKILRTQSRNDTIKL